MLYRSTSNQELLSSLLGFHHFHTWLIDVHILWVCVDISLMIFIDLYATGAGTG
jgi:hypothetical protein